MRLLRFAVLALLSLMPALGYAQTTPVTATNVTLGGQPVNGYLYLTPVGGGGTYDGSAVSYSTSGNVLGSTSSQQTFAGVLTGGALASPLVVPDQCTSSAMLPNTNIDYLVQVVNTYPYATYSFRIPASTCYISGSAPMPIEGFRAAQTLAMTAPGLSVATSMPNGGHCKQPADLTIFTGTTPTNYKCGFDNMFHQVAGNGSGGPGTPGSNFLQSNGAPSNSTGNNGDSNLDVTTGNVYLKSAGSWGLTGNLKGAQGTPGTPGNNGVSPTVSVNKTTTLPAGSSATVTVDSSSTSSNTVLNFGIPQGLQGTPGSGGSNPAIPANNIDVTTAPYYASPYGATTTTTSASVASGATSVPVASVNTFAVGNGVLVAGGGSTGWTGSDYIGTITAVSGNTLTVTPALSATAASGAVVKHDDSAALNAITTFCKTSDCGVYFPPIPGTSTGTYRINGPILDTSYSNAMIVLPNAALTGGTGTSFRMYSSTRPESTANAVTIQSDYAGSGAISIFGVKVNGGAFGGFNNTYVSLSNLRFSSGNAANQHIVECGFCKGFTTDGHIWVMAQSGNTGIGYPVISNDVDISSDTLTILNMTNAVRPGEHTYIKALHGANNVCAVTPDSLTNNSGVTGHANSVTIGNLWNQVSTNLVCGGTTPQNIAIQSADAEVIQNISNDPNNMLTGYVNYHVPYNDGRTSQTITGAPNKVGSANLRLINLDTGVCYGSTCPVTAAPASSRTANLVYSWPMNEGSGTSSTDSVSGNNLALTGVTWTTDSTLGAVPSFSGSSSGAVSANNSNANFTNSQAFSISAWVKPTNTTYGELISTLQGTSPYTGYVLSVGTTQLQLQLNGTSGGNAIVCTTASGTVPTNSLTHVVMTYDGSSSSGGVTFYVNGTAVGKNCSTNALSTSIASGQKIGIGTDPQGGNYLNSIIARFRIYSAAITAGDVSTIYTNKN